MRKTPNPDPPKGCIKPEPPPSPPAGIRDVKACVDGYEMDALRYGMARHVAINAELKAELSALRKLVDELIERFEYWLPDETMVDLDHAHDWDKAVKLLQRARELRGRNA